MSNSTQTTNTTGAASSVSSASTPVTSSSTPSASPFCASGFVCGESITQLKMDMQTLEKRLEKVEGAEAAKKKYFKKAEKLLTIFHYVLIAIPVVLFVALASVQYVCAKNGAALNVLTGVIGIGACVDVIFVPAMLKKIENRLNELEEILNDE